MMQGSFTPSQDIWENLKFNMADNTKHLRLTLTPKEPGEGCDLPCSWTIEVVLGLPLIT